MTHSNLSHKELIEDEETVKKSQQWMYIARIVGPTRK